MKNYLKAKKPFITLIAISILILSFSVSAFAAAVHIECEDFEEFGGEQFGGANVQNLDDGIVVVGSKPDEIEVECYTSFNVDIPEAGIYTFKINYAASESDSARKGDLILNDKRYNIPVIQTPDWSTFNTAIVNAEIEAGTLLIKLASPEDFDNDTVKTCNFDWIEYDITEKIAPIEENPEPIEPKNPGTTDVTEYSAILMYILATLSSVSTLGILAAKKKNK